MYRALLVFALLFAGLTPCIAAEAPTPQAQASVPAGAPVNVLDCSVDFNSLSGIVDKLHVDFMNVSTQAVTQITFGVHITLSTPVEVMDVGTFRPNLRIHHDLEMPMARIFRFAQGLDCTVDAVRFADGTTWASPTPQPSPLSPWVDKNY